jgi:serine/threonine protein kinase
MYCDYTRLYSPDTLLDTLDTAGSLPGLPFRAPRRRLKLLGAGCFGLVVAMRADADKRTYAVKFVNEPDMAAELEIHKLAAVAGLAPPLYGGFFSVADDWCAMPMLKVDAVPLGPEHARAIKRLVARLHALDISHGDIKPSNFLATRGGGRVYISDFGCSIDHNKKEGKTKQPPLLAGDPRYMPPASSLTAKKTKERAFEIDMYSLQKTLNEIKCS